MDNQSLRLEQADFSSPYRSSWMDFLVDRIKRLPIPSWVFYLSLFVASILVSNVLFWIDGSIKFGNFYPEFTYGALFIIYGLALFQFLAKTAGESLDDFYPFLKPEPAFEKELAYKMTRMPASWGWAAMVLGISLLILDMSSSQFDITFNSLTTKIYAGLFGAFGYCTFLAMMFQTSRQLYFIIKLHGKIAGIDLFNLRPLRAFSRFTATAGFAVFFIGAYNLLVFSKNSSGTLILIYLLMALVGISLFIAPLISISTRIKNEKKERILEVDQNMKRILLQIKDNFAQDNLTKMGEFNTTLNLLEKEKSILKGISSFPWNPDAFRTFLSSIILPLLLWWVKTFLEKWF
jgi:hypothetical protein